MTFSHYSLSPLGFALSAFMLIITAWRRTSPVEPLWPQFEWVTKSEWIILSRNTEVRECHQEQQTTTWFSQRSLSISIILNKLFFHLVVLVSTR